jgi:thiol:disulfide interchange protein DsbC
MLEQHTPAYATHAGGRPRRFFFLILASAIGVWSAAAYPQAASPAQATAPDVRDFRRVTTAEAFAFNDLPLELAIKQTRGSGKRVMAVFEDPRCPFCKRLEKSLQQVDDVTVYVFLYPVLGDESVAKARSVWCSPDPAKAWRDLMIQGKAPVAAGDCSTPIPHILALGQRMGVRGTPTIIFADGRRLAGAPPPDQLESYLDAAGKQ